MDDCARAKAVVCGSFQQALLAHGYLVPLGVPGVYGRSGAFEQIVSGLQQLISRAGADQKAAVLRFPPLLPTAAYLRTDHLDTMPDLLGCVHGFCGDDRALSQLLQKRATGKDWAGDLTSSGLVLVPAACYPLYPTLTGNLPQGGRVFDIETTVFRNEPSLDPGRMQSFRQREYVCAGTATQALAHRDLWLERAQRLLSSLGLAVTVELASDPFFGRGARVMKAQQREQALKYELLAPVALENELTALSSCNFHTTHFGKAFGIFNSDSAPASTACVGFGLERITLALLRCHGCTLSAWPNSVRELLHLK